MSLFCRRRYPFTVTVHLGGRHPYLQSTELDYESRDVVLMVSARSWKDAEKQALNAASSIPNKWRYYVKSIAHGAVLNQEGRGE